MKVILYIGHHKTGSTSLQAFLSQNWLPLAQTDILYPSVESRGFASNLKRALTHEEWSPKLMNVREPHSALAYRMIADVSHRPIPPQFKAVPVTGQIIHALKNQVEMLQPQVLILCSEAFSNFGQVSPDLVDKLCRIFPKAEFTVYCALRRPDDYIISWHGQRLKVGERLAALHSGGGREYLNSIHFDYRLMLQAWAERVPNVRLILRNYSDVLKAGGSVEDFVAATGLPLPEGTIPAARANPSLPRAAFEIIRQANQDLPQKQALMLRNAVLQHQPRDLPTANDQVEMFTPDLRAEMATRFAPIHDYLNSLTGQDSFFPDLAEIALPRPVPEHEATAELLARIDPNTLPPDVSDFIQKRQDTSS